MKRIIFNLILILLLSNPIFSKTEFCDWNLGWGPTSQLDSILIEGFENLQDWQAGSVNKEKVTLSSVQGKFKNALRINYDLLEKGKFIYFRKPVQVNFNKDCRISFWIRAQGATNQFEFKIVDADGSTFMKRWESGVQPSDWHKIVFDISELTYTWGGENTTPEPPYHLELIISRRYSTIQGQKGWIELDELRFDGLAPHLKLSLNQIGFDPAHNKRAVIKLANTMNWIDTPLKYQLISISQGNIILSGQALPFSSNTFWPDQYWIIQFDPLKTPGKYKLKAELINDSMSMSVESYPFEIKKNILVKELSESQFYYIRSTRYPLKTRHNDPVPGGYIDTEFDIEKWMSTTPTWVWGMAHWVRLIKDKNIKKDSKAIDEISYAAQFCIKMQAPDTGGVYLGVNKTFEGVWPGNMTAEKDTNDLVIKNYFAADLNTGYTVAMVEAALALKKADPALAERALQSGIKAWKYLSLKKLNSSPDLGMYLWASMRLYKATKDTVYLEIAKETAEKLLPLQFLNYKLSQEGIFGRFYFSKKQKNFKHQHKFVHAMGIYMGLMELAEQLNNNDPLREKIIFHLNCFAYGYLKKTSELNPFGLVAQALEPDKKSKKMHLYYFASPKSEVSDHGLNCDIMAMGIIALRYSRLTQNREFARIAVDQINWILGNNPLGFCMISGKGTTNPYVMAMDWNKGPVRGGLPNGYVSPKHGNKPKWIPGWNSGEYWKPHNAMLLVLMAELESDQLIDPFINYKSVKNDIILNDLYKKIDGLLNQQK